MWFCAVWTLAFMLASALAAALGVEAFTAAAVSLILLCKFFKFQNNILKIWFYALYFMYTPQFFGFCAMIAYGYDAFLKFKDVRMSVAVVVIEKNPPPVSPVTVA